MRIKIITTNQPSKFVFFIFSKIEKVIKKLDLSRAEVIQKENEIKKLNEKIADFEVRIGQLNLEKNN